MSDEHLPSRPKQVDVVKMLPSIGMPDPTLAFEALILPALRQKVSESGTQQCANTAERLTTVTHEGNDND